MLIYLSQEKIDQICELAAARMAAEKGGSDMITIPSKEADELVEEILNEDPKSIWPYWNLYPR